MHDHTLSYLVSGYWLHLNARIKKPEELIVPEVITGNDDGDVSCVPSARLYGLRSWDKSTTGDIEIELYASSASEIMFRPALIVEYSLV